MRCAHLFAHLISLPNGYNGYADFCTADISEYPQPAGALLIVDNVSEKVNRLQEKNVIRKMSFLFRAGYCSGEKFCGKIGVTAAMRIYSEVSNCGKSMEKKE